MVADMTDCFVALMLPGAGDELQGIKRGLLEMVDIIVVSKADGDTRRAAEVAAQQYSLALKLLAARRKGEDEPEVLTCSALCHQNVDTVWDAVKRRHARWQASGELTERRRQQNLRWLWSMVQEHLRQAVQTHPNVRAIRAALEQDVLSGAMPPESAAREILEAFGLTGEIGHRPT